MKARLPQGFGGGPGNMQSRLSSSKKQEEMAKVQAELEEREYTVTAGGGAVEVLISGKKEIKSVTLKPEIVDPGGH